MVARPTDLGSQQALLDGMIEAAKVTPAATVAQIKAQALAILQIITLSPKPNYNINGKLVQHAAYAQTLMDLVRWANEIEAVVDTTDTAPYELETEAFG